MQGRRVFIIAAISLAAAPAHAGPSYSYALDTHSSVNARVAFMGLSSKSAGFPDLSGHVVIEPGRLQRVNLDVSIDARSLTTSDNLTLNRLKSPAFFDVDHFPTIRFQGQSMAMTGDRSARITGLLTARGVSRPSVLRVTFAAPPARITGRDPLWLTGTTVIDRREFGMTAWPTVVGRKVTITLSARMVPR